jgi:hypothetical protein
VPVAGIKEPTAGRLEFSMVVVDGLDWVVDSTEAGESMSSLLSDLSLYSDLSTGRKEGGGFVFSIRAIKGWVPVLIFYIRAINRAKAINEEMQWQ